MNVKMNMNNLKYPISPVEPPLIFNELPSPPVRMKRETLTNSHYNIFYHHHS